MFLFIDSSTESTFYIWARQELLTNGEPFKNTCLNVFILCASVKILHYVSRNIGMFRKRVVEVRAVGINSTRTTDSGCDDKRLTATLCHCLCSKREARNIHGGWRVWFRRLDYVQWSPAGSYIKYSLKLNSQPYLLRAHPAVFASRIGTAAGRRSELSLRFPALRNKHCAVHVCDALPSLAKKENISKAFVKKAKNIATGRALRQLCPTIHTAKGIYLTWSAQ